MVLGHIRIPTELWNIIYSFHMPLFFFISGYLEKDRKLKNTVVNGVQTLIIPYVLLYVLNYLSGKLLRQLIFGDITFNNALIKPFWGMLLGVGYDTDTSIMVVGPLWFLIALFFVKIFNSILQSISNGKTFYYVLGNVCVIGIVLFLKQLNIDLLLSIDSALLALPFFAIGHVFKKQNIIKVVESGNKRQFGLTCLGVVIGFTLLVTIVPFNGRVDVNGCNYGNNIVLFYVIGMVGILATVLLSMLYTNSSKIITIISSGTILILAFSGKITNLILGNDVLINPVVGIIVTTITVLLFIPVIVLVKKYFPILMGGRK